MAVYTQAQVNTMLAGARLESQSGGCNTYKKPDGKRYSVCAAGGGLYQVTALPGCGVCTKKRR